MSDTKLSRQQLYEQIWSVPASRLATEFGLSDVGLAKLCKRHDIPRPHEATGPKKIGTQRADSQSKRGLCSDSRQQLKGKYLKKSLRVRHGGEGSGYNKCKLYREQFPVTLPGESRTNCC
ncbi:hypothetical protein CA11_28930 [Gimesia maris]|nr:hypothetical protein CA11_28930 [Gimesia maris]